MLKIFPLSFRISKQNWLFCWRQHDNMIIYSYYIWFFNSSYQVLPVYQFLVYITSISKVIEGGWILFIVRVKYGILQVETKKRMKIHQLFIILLLIILTVRGYSTVQSNPIWQYLNCNSRSFKPWTAETDLFI